jgi:hypothetical protein
MMNRITADQVLTAYRAIGMRPQHKVWLSDTSCCGLTACVLAKRTENKEAINIMLKKHHICDMYGFIGDELKLTRRYIHGFIDGFDSNTIYASGQNEYATGVTDGAAARELVWPIALRVPT